MPTWFFFALATFLLWGVWAICTKLADQAGYAPLSVFVVSNAVGFVIAMGAFATMRFHLEPNAKAIGWSVAAGIIGTAAIICFFFALSRGKAAIVVPFTAMYPVVTLILGLAVLKERITWTQGLGIGCALLATFLLSRPD